MTTITIDRAVLEQALEALDSAVEVWCAPWVVSASTALREALNAPQPEPQPLSIDQISMIFNRVYPAQPLSQNIINLVQEVEKHHGIK